MTDHPAQPAEVAALLHDHGDRWQIEHEDGLDVWTAVRKSPDGRHIRVLVAHDPASLRGKLAGAEDEEPGPDNPPGVAQPGGGWISGPCNPPASP
jgi:hypothetical protein